MQFSTPRSWRFGTLAMKDAEDNRNEDQRCDSSKNEAADDGAAERRILLAPPAKARRHGQHADDHGKRRHQHRTKADEAGLDGGGDRIAEYVQSLTRKADDQHAV